MHQRALDQANAAFRRHGCDDLTTRWPFGAIALSVGLLACLALILHVVAR